MSVEQGESESGFQHLEQASQIKQQLAVNIPKQERFRTDAAQFIEQVKVLREKHAPKPSKPE